MILDIHMNYRHGFDDYALLQLCFQLEDVLL